MTDDKQAVISDVDAGGAHVYRAMAHGMGPTPTPRAPGFRISKKLGAWLSGAHSSLKSPTDPSRVRGRIKGEHNITTTPH